MQNKPAASAQPQTCALFTTPEYMRRSIQRHLRFSLARDAKTANPRAWWLATCLALRDHILERYLKTQQVHHQANTRRLYYLSMEYLVGRLLPNNLYCAGLYEVTQQALEQLGLSLESLIEQEVDMGLGNGGLGRLAVCFLDSLATLEYPAIGYGIRYEFGLFEQRFVNGRQLEVPDTWLEFGNPWQIMRPEYAQAVNLYGRTENYVDLSGRTRSRWVDCQSLLGVPWDIPVVGYGARTVNFLRLWESRASKQFDLGVFNAGGYVEAVREKAVGETVSKVLYPNDHTEAGKELRLVQQYFFVACSLQDIVRRFRVENANWELLPEKMSLQLNDTHPAVAILELMRILVDQEDLPWDLAWKLCRGCFAYTNHTLLPEALEKWPVPLFQKVLPRHLEIVQQINAEFLDREVATYWPGDLQKREELSLIEEGSPKMIRMAYLAVVGSFSVNGVAELHSRLLKERLFPAFDVLYPQKFNNKTNGITPRRWLKVCNPRLSALLDQTVGPEWVTDLDRLRALEPKAEDPAFREAFMRVKRQNKEDLCSIIQERCGMAVNPDALFDVQIKRLHEYKRQHLNLLYILTLYQHLLNHPHEPSQPRVCIFGAKAAPGYGLAKSIIHAINAVARQINADARVKDKLQVVFLPNYNVSLAEKIIPAADLSEQISTAGKEASGTGNMKLALNGAVTLGTLDGANIEILQEVGPENIFIFGLKVEEVEHLRAKGYQSRQIYEQNPALQAIFKAMDSDAFSVEERGALHHLRSSLLEGGDPFFVLADYTAYCQAQQAVEKAFRDRDRWAKMAILNTARMGFFSSDRSIRQYAQAIWKLSPVPVPDGE